MFSTIEKWAKDRFFSGEKHKWLINIWEVFNLVIKIIQIETVWYCFLVYKIDNSNTQCQWDGSKIGAFIHYNVSKNDTAFVEDNLPKYVKIFFKYLSLKCSSPRSK